MHTYNTLACFIVMLFVCVCMCVCVCVCACVCACVHVFVCDCSHCTNKVERLFLSFNINFYFKFRIFVLTVQMNHTLL